MCQKSLRSLVAALLLLFAVQTTPSRGEDEAASRSIQEEIWTPPLPIFAYLVRPVGDGPFPLAIMNHGVAMSPTDRSFFPLVDAAKWFAERGYLVVAPVGTGYGAAAIDIPEHGLYGPFFSKVGNCSNPNFRAPGMAVAQVDLWIIDYMTAEKRIAPKDMSFGLIRGGHVDVWTAGRWARPSRQLDDPRQNGSGNGRGDGSRERRQAGDRRDAARGEGEIKDRRQMHAAANVDKVGELGRDGYGGHRFPRRQGDPAGNRAGGQHRRSSGRNGSRAPDPDTVPEMNI